MDIELKILNATTIPIKAHTIENPREIRVMWSIYGATYY